MSMRLTKVDMDTNSHAGDLHLEWLSLHSGRCPPGQSIVASQGLHSHSYVHDLGDASPDAVPIFIANGMCYTLRQREHGSSGPLQSEHLVGQVFFFANKYAQQLAY